MEGAILTFSYLKITLLGNIIHFLYYQVIHMKPQDTLNQAGNPTAHLLFPKSKHFETYSWFHTIEIS